MLLKTISFSLLSDQTHRRMFVQKLLHYLFLIFSPFMLSSVFADKQTQINIGLVHSCQINYFTIIETLILDKKILKH